MKPEDDVKLQVTQDRFHPFVVFTSFYYTKNICLVKERGVRQNDFERGILKSPDPKILG